MGVDAWALIVSIVALVGSGIGWLLGRSDAAEARKDADKARAAADEAVDAARRSAAALEKQVELATPPAVAFRIEHRGGSEFLLRNVGTQTVSGIGIDQTDIPGVLRPPSGSAVLAPNQAVDFQMSATRNTPIPASLAVECGQHPEWIWVEVPPLG